MRRSEQIDMSARGKNTETARAGERRGQRVRRPRTSADVSLQLGPDEDIADVSLVVWARERPDIDASAKAVTGRILRLSEMLLARMNADLDALDLTYSVYAILATLRTIGAPDRYRMSPSQLKGALTVSSGGMSNLLKKVERLGYIRRTTDPRDGRGVIVELTKTGLALADRAMPLQARAEQELTGMFSPAERKLLVGLLRRMIICNR